MRHRALAMATPFALLLASCNLLLWSPCEDTVYATRPSPDGSLVATLYARNCGATTPINRQVGLRSADRAFDGSEGSVLAVRGEPDIELSWLNDATLAVSCEGCAASTTFRREARWQGVEIRYDWLDR